MPDANTPPVSVKETSLLEDVRRELVSVATPPVACWRLSLADDPGNTTVDDSGWEEVNLPSKLTNTSAAWYRTTVEAPSAHFGWNPSGVPVVLRWSARQFAEVYVNGRYMGRCHGARGKAVLVDEAAPGQTFDVALRVSGQRGIQGGVSEGSSVGESGLYTAHLEIGDLDSVREAVSELLKRLDVCEKMIQLTGQGGYVLEQAAREIDREAIRRGDTEALLASIRNAFEALAGLDDLFKRYTISLTSNAHIDMAWLWDREETKQVCHDTFRSVLDLMKEYPDFVFAHSQAHSYAWVEELWPDMFEEIRQRVAEGRWEIVGGMWVEPDCNLPSGESFVRQVLYGKRYFQQKFGVDVTLGWNPDSFGYNWSMPQVYSKCGINAFLTQKLTWNDTNVWPHRAFWWESPDGSRIFSYFPTDYVGHVQSNGLIADLVTFSTATGYKRTDHLFGIGDHGGGPTRDMLDRADALSSLKPFPTVRHQRARDFIDTLLAEADQAKSIPVWNSELYLEYHRGTFTSQAAIKKGNRDAERLLRRLEVFSLLARDRGVAYPAEALERMWKDTLFNQFHDILPGSCIRAAAEDAWSDYEAIRSEGGALLDAALTAVASGTPDEDGAGTVTVFNGLNYPRNGVVSIPTNVLRLAATSGLSVEGPDGRAVPAQVADENGTAVLLFEATDVPAMGAAAFRVVSNPTTGSSDGLAASQSVIENRFVRVEIAPDGTFSRVYDKAAGRDVLAEGEAGNVLQAFVDRPGKWEAWEIDKDFEAAGDVLRNPVQIEVLESGPVRARVRTTRTWSQSTFVQDITLTAGSPRVDIVTTVDWQDRQRLLKVMFPVNVKAETASYEVPYAAIERSTGNETSIEKAQFEVPALQWADLSADGFGVSLLNDSKHGHDIKGNRMRLTLLRSPNSPDPRADQGRHTFTYSLYPHQGDWSEGGTFRAAMDLNDPLIARPGGKAGETVSWLEIGPENVLLSACKKAEDSDDVIIRFYETAGRDGEAVLTFATAPAAVWETDMMENDTAPVSVTGSTITVPLGHNEVKTLKVRF